MRIITKESLNNPLDEFYGVVGEPTTLKDSIGNSLYVGDKVLIAPGTKLAEIETSFVVNPHVNNKYGSYYMPYIAGYEGITIYDYYETSIEEFFGFSAYDIDNAIKVNNTEIIEEISAVVINANAPRIFRLIPYDKCKGNETCMHKLMITTVSDKEYKNRAI